MAKIEIYTSPWCGYCARAKALLGWIKESGAVRRNRRAGD